MAIQVSEHLPKASFKILTSSGMKELSTDDVFKNKKVLLFALPGAFTPTCSSQHVPGYLKEYDHLKAKGFDTIACISVNDAFVMEAWAKSLNVGDKVLMLADGNGDFTKAMGLELDGRGFGLGTRSKRYAMIVDNGIVKSLEIDQGGGCDVSSAEKMLALDF
jgi:glutaredoxin/glutathione-dependent peroxiredoxin